MESLTKTIEEENSQRISLERSILKEIKEKDVTCCQSIYYNIFQREIETEPLVSDPESYRKSGLEIDLKDLRYANLVRSLKYLKFFDVNKFILYRADSKNKHFEDFLESSFPNTTNQLYFLSENWMDLNKPNYLNSLTRLSSKVIQTVTFESFYIGLSQLKRLVVTYKNVRVLALVHCRLSIPSVPDFSKALTNCKIQELDLHESGNSYCSEWEKNFGQVKSLTQGLSGSPDLRLSLKKVDFTDCGVNQNEVEKIFEENQLGEVEIIMDEI
ncbi:unnamed protein product [Moneuplotes crassus]|uniref:Uncharacterized protein n=1 Tax=Euplotes crassus TaxID=5936 RepID=A0AAD2CW85_EUPCR|nr:unnamed protein product [Moneuplotes crassus]